MLWQATVHALRRMRQNPGYAATSVLTLALTIGGNTAMFTVIRAVLLKPLPYPDSDELVTMPGGATPSRFAEMRTAAHSLAGLGAFSGEETLTLSGRGEPEVLKGARVSASFLPILGAHAMRGRGFRTQEDLPGAPPVVMISAELWQRRFAGDPGIVGQTAAFAGAPYTIVGILPPHFRFPFPDLDVWMTAPLEWPAMPAKSRAMSPFLSMFGRLKPGVGLEQASAELKVIRRRYAMAHPAALDAKARKAVEVIAMKDGLVAGVQSML
ncbi:MAG: ABC transporter permease, partial [Acidobacteriota bacterium]|nr:ABC transporter permease [Acidobacteriota bacterium]